MVLLNVIRAIIKYINSRFIVLIYAIHFFESVNDHVIDCI